MAKRIDLTGRSFGRWLVESYCYTNKYRVSYWNVKCRCGNKKVVSGQVLKNKTSRSCGCLKSQMAKEALTTHGLTGTPTYKTWKSMKGRCLNPSDQDYANYGGRGIQVCERWMSFENFFADMGEKNKELTLERVNNNGNYEPGNCVYATRMSQGNNKRNNNLLTFNNKTMTFSQWSRKTGINAGTLRSRIYDSKWGVEKALTSPVNKNKRR